MAQATFSVRMDEVLKKQFDALCQEFGMNASTAILPGMEQCRHLWLYGHRPKITVSPI